MRNINNKIDSFVLVKFPTRVICDSHLRVRKQKKEGKSHKPKIKYGKTVVVCEINRS